MRANDFFSKARLLEYSKVRRQLTFVATAILLATPGSAISDTKITPFISVKESLVENETPAGSESGNVTIIAPGFNLLSEGPRSYLSLDYRYNAIFSNGLEQDDNQIQELNLESRYEHKPDIWVSTLDASSQQVNTDVNGIQDVALEFSDVNSDELLTVQGDTTVTDKLSSTVDYLTRLNADYARLGDSDPTTGYGFLAGLDNYRAQRQFYWKTSIDSQVARDQDSESRIDELDINLNYRLNRKWSAFTDYTRTETDQNAFEEDFVLVGMIWQPTIRTYVKAGVGDREGEDAYILDARHTRQTFSMSATYDEDVTSLREDTLDQAVSDISAQGTTALVSIEPVLQKRTTINFSIQGQYTEITATAFRIDRSGGTSIEDEITDGLKFYYLRQMTAKSSVAANLQYEETSATEDNELTDIRFDYLTQYSRDERIILSLGWTEQQSTQKANEYERTLLSAEYIVSF